MEIINTMKPLYCIALFAIVFSFASCDEGSGPNPDLPSAPSYPTLKIVNGSNQDRIITNVELVGYNFNNLKITKGTSQIFILDKGMPAGYSNTNIDIRHVASHGLGPLWESQKVNFSNGTTTTVNLKY